MHFIRDAVNWPWLRAKSQAQTKSLPRFPFRVLLRFLWLVFAWFQAEFAAEKENSNSVMLEDTKASGCGLNGLDAAVESFGRSVADR